MRLFPLRWIVVGLTSFFQSVAPPACAETTTKTEIVPAVPHAQVIYGLALDADGTHMATGDADGIVKIWDVRTRQLLRTLEKDIYGINALAFSPSGKTLLSAGKAGWSIKLFDAATGQRIREFKGHSGEVRCVAFSPDGRLVASGGSDSHIMLWDAATGSRLFDLDGSGQDLRTLAFTPDGKRLLTGGFDQQLQLWDVETGKLVRNLTGPSSLRYLKSMIGLGPERHEDVFLSIAVTPDGKWALTGSWGQVRNVKLWNLSTGKLERTFEGQSQDVMSVGFTTDGSEIFAAGEYGELVVWNAATGKITRKIAPHGRDYVLQNAVLSPRGKQLAAVGSKAPELWDIDTGAIVSSFGDGLRLGLEAEFTQDGSRLAVTSGNGVAIWDVVGGRLLRNIGSHDNDVVGVAISRDGSIVLTGGKDKLVKLWDVASGKLIRTFAGHANSVEHVALTRDKRYAASGSSIDGIIKIWDVESGKQLQELRGHAASLAKLEFSADGLALLSGSWDGSVILWDLTRGQKRFDFKTDVRAIYNPRNETNEQAQRAIDWVGFSTDGTRLMAVTHDGAVAMWDAHTGAELTRRPALSSYMNPVILSHDGTNIFSDANIGTVDVNDTATGQELSPLPDAAKAGSLAFATSADDHLLAAIGNDYIVRIWDTRSRKLLVSLFNGGSDAWAVLTPQGFFSASPKADSLLGIVRGMESISIGQTWQSLYAPDLVREALAGDPDGDLQRASEVINLDKVVESGPAPLVEITSPLSSSTSTSDLVKVTVRVADRGKGIGRVEWRVNGITAAVSRAKPESGEAMLEQQLALDPGPNAIEVVAYNARNVLASLPARTIITYSGATNTAKSKLHVLAIGINAYHDSGWQPQGSEVSEFFPPLTLAAGDAATFASEMKRAAKGFYSDVSVTTLTDSAATAQKIESAINRLSGSVDPRDTFVLYVAAHGYSLDGRFYLIPQDFDGGTNPDALARKAVGQDRLQDWIANKIHARRALILLDTCESGALTNGYAHSRTDGPASDAALGRLHEATGRPVLAAAAAGKPAFEGYRGHGVFTWALLDALYHGDTNADGNIALSELVAHVQDTVPRISAELAGTGRAAVVMRGGTADDRQSAHFGAVGADFTLVHRLQ